MVRARLICICSFFSMLLTGGIVAVAQDKPGPPDVAVQIIPETDGGQPGRTVALFVTVTNKSAIPLQDLSFASQNEAFPVESSGLPASLPAFASTWVRAKLEIPRKGTAFGKHQIPFVLTYRWKDGQLGGVSAQTATVTIAVQRWLDEEAKGLPGGTAALFSLLFPIIPAFLGFQIMDRLRRHEGLRVPTFGSEYIVPAFFIALLINSLALFPRLPAPDSDEPLEIVVSSFLLGALWPALRWIWDLVLRWWWGFRETDSPESYLRKALLSPWSPRPFTWMTGKVGEKETWSGILLRQPDGSPALGSRVQISPAKQANAADKASAPGLVQAVNTTGSLRSRWRLLWKVMTKKLTVGAAAFPQQGDGQTSTSSGRIAVAGDVLGSFQRQKGERQDFLTYSP
jgi:hypothetical protein